MKKIAVKLPEVYVDGLDRLVKTGFYPNRAEAIRFAIRDMLQVEVDVKPKVLCRLAPMKTK